MAKEYTPANISQEKAEQLLIGQSDEDFTDDLFEDEADIPDPDDGLGDLDMNTEYDDIPVIPPTAARRSGTETRRITRGIGRGEEDDGPVPAVLEMDELELEVQEYSDIGETISLGDDVAKSSFSRQGKVKVNSEDSSAQEQAAKLKESRLNKETKDGLKVEEEPVNEKAEYKIPKMEEVPEQQTEESSNYAPVGDKVEQPKDYDSTEQDTALARPKQSSLTMEQAQEQLDIALGLSGDEETTSVPEPEVEEVDQGIKLVEATPDLQVIEEQQQTHISIPLDETTLANIVTFNTNKPEFRQTSMAKQKRMTWEQHFQRKYRQLNPPEEVSFDSDIGWFLRNNEEVSSHVVISFLGLHRTLGLQAGSEAKPAKFFRNVRFKEGTYCIGFVDQDDPDILTVVRIKEELL